MIRHLVFAGALAAVFSVVAIAGTIDFEDQGDGG